MTLELLQKYITGQADEAENRQVTEWIHSNPEHMREYLAQRKLFDISIWQSTDMQDNQPATRHFNIRPALREATKLAAMFALAFISFYLWDTYISPDKEVTKTNYQSIYVPAGQRSELTLADGTKVWLNARTRLTFPTTFDNNLRKVKLEGEGFFDVTKDAEHPFIVETEKCNIKVLGTEFNVTAYAQDSIWEAALLKGSIELIEPETQQVNMRLEPNTVATLQNNRFVKRSLNDTEHYRWREGLICFDNITAGEMLKKLSLYYGVEFVVNNYRIQNNRYTGKFRTSDGVEHVLRVMKLNHKFNYKRDDENNRIIIY